MGGRENLRARSSRRSEKGLGRHGVDGEVRWREGESYIITKKYCLM